MSDFVHHVAPLKGDGVGSKLNKGKSSGNMRMVAVAALYALLFYLHKYF